MQFKSVEDAYLMLANYVQAFIGARQWDEAGCQMRVFGKMARGSQWLIDKGIRDEQGGFEADQNAIWGGLDAAIFLRNNILATTGDRIWGLTFTLYPDGRFSIEYDYNKPEGYEDTDESISVDDAIKGLSGFHKG